MALVNCKRCGAELSDDRETCPHCGEAIVPAAQVAIDTAANDKERGLIQSIVKLEQENGRLVDQCNYLKSENNRLNSENAELRKQVGGPPPNVEKTGPGVVVTMPAATGANSPDAAKTV